MNVRQILLVVNKSVPIRMAATNADANRVLLYKETIVPAKVRIKKFGCNMCYDALTFQTRFQDKQVAKASFIIYGYSLAKEINDRFYQSL